MSTGRAAVLAFNKLFASRPRRAALALGMREGLDSFGEKISRVGHHLLLEQRRGLEVPTYATEALRQAVALDDRRRSAS